jgi:Dyp-type peroxidase family
MAESSISLDYADIQGIILNGYGHQKHLLLLFLHVDDSVRAKGWLKATLPHVRSAQRRARNEPKPHTSANIALSWPGLQAFGVQSEAQLTFPREYWQGMGHGERTRVLGDTGDCDPKYWEFGGTTTPELHLLLMLYADSKDTLDEVTEQLWTSTAATSGLSEVYRQYSHKPNINEPFGFRDGVSQPAIAGVEGVVLPGQDVLKTGEFILGYENEYGQKPPMPTIAAAQDPANLLPADEIQKGRKAFGNNGSYMVVRKLEQDVTGFWDYMDRKTRRPDGTSDEYAKVFLAAKIVGRWPSGAPLTLAPEKDDPELGADLQRNNVFTFLVTDGEGHSCPIGAHMRRANPRDTMPPNPQKSLQVASHHRILRRGRPYKETKDGVEKEGLVFIVMNADLQRQFEFIQQSWVNSPKFNGLYDNRDPLVSNFDSNTSNAEGDTDNSATDAAPQGTIMSIQGNPVRRRLTDVPRFVQIKGGGYFFLPGIKTLHYLAN